MSSGWFWFELIPVFVAIAQILEFGNTKSPRPTLKKFKVIKLKNISIEHLFITQITGKLTVADT